MIQNKFGSVEYFSNYIQGQLDREDKTVNRQELIQRVFYSMSSVILENFKGKEMMIMLKNLHMVTEQYSTQFEGSKSL